MPLAGFNNSFKLTIDSSKIDEDLTDFPVNITLSSGTGQTGFDATDVFTELATITGTKNIAITDSNDNQLYVEIERWDWENEEANLWVKVPTIASGTDTVLYLYYDATTSGNTTYVGDTGESPAQQVWDSNFKGVWHMSQDPSGGSNCILDSTSNSNDGSPYNMDASNLVDGAIGKGIEHDGVAGGDNVVFGAPFIAATIHSYTMSSFFKLDDLSAAHVFFVNLTSNVDYTIQTNVTSDGGVAYIHRTSGDAYQYMSLFTAASVEADSWYYLSISTNTDTTDVNAYLNSTHKLKTSATSFKDFTTKWNSAIDNAAHGGWVPIDGTLDEMRLSNTARSNAWMKADYYSVWNNLVTFSELTTFTFSSPIPVPLSTVYGVAHQLQLTTTITGNESSYIYDATFYDASDDGQIGSTISGTPSGQYVSTTMTTVSATNYSWYVTATSSGQSDTSNSYDFSNRFMCSGYTQVAGTGTSGISVRLYRRSNGEYIGGAISSGVSGTFDIITDYNEYHYAVALYSTDDTNALIADWLKPDN